jgi:hypothetical protein
MTGSSFEVAREILNEPIGRAANRIDAERAKPEPEPDQTVIDSWQKRRKDWEARWQRLNPRDMEFVQAVLEEDGAFLRSLRPARA